MTTDELFFVAMIGFAIGILLLMTHTAVYIFALRKGRQLGWKDSYQRRRWWNLNPDTDNDPP